MKITHIIFSLNTGGSETMLVDIINQQCLMHKIDLIIINNSYSDNLLTTISENVKIHFIERREKSLNPLEIVKLHLLLYKINPIVIHCHNHNIIDFLKYKTNATYCLTVHAVGIKHKLFGRYDKLFAISQAVKNDILDRSGLDSQIIYNGIDFTKIQSKDRVASLPKVFKMVQVGRLEHEKKGQHILLRAIHELIRNGISDISVDFIGEGSSLKYLMKLVNDLQLYDCVNFIGLKNRDYIYGNLCTYDLLVQPSLSEGFGLTVVEAMAAKIPVLVSNIYGPMEIIKNGQLGYSFDSGSAESCAAQIEFIFQNRNSNEVNNKVEGAYNNALECFNIKNTAANYVKQYLRS